MACSAIAVNEEGQTMRWLLPIGALLIAIGTAGSAAACYGSSIFDGPATETMASQMDGQTDAPAATGTGETPRLFLAPLAGLTLAIGLVCVGIGIGNWRRPIPSDVRPANPYSDQPKEQGDPPVGQV
jgi:hypothetical protein